METISRMQQRLMRWKRLPAAVLALTLAVLALTIILASLNLRAKVREQIINRDGEILQVLSRNQQAANEKSREEIGSFDEPAEQFDHILNIATLKGILGFRMFTPDGIFTNAFPAYIADAELPTQDMPALRALKPVGHYLPEASLESVDMLAVVEGPMKPVPLLEIEVPLQAHDPPRLVGVAQFLLQGDSIAQDFAVLDRNLAIQAGTAFLVGGGILTMAILLSFRGIQRANLLLAAQAERLRRANQELTLAAKTSAVGAVASHLIHGLKNPLSGLQGFVNSHAAGRSTESEEDWRDAAATTQKMQTLIAGVVRILEEQHAVGSYEISLRELGGIISSRMQPVARAAGIHFHALVRAEGMLGNREANLTILILENLIQNAFQVSREGGSVWLKILREDPGVRFEVQDEGPGFPEDLKERLFSPCRSSKPGGSGIGLAISKHLALNIGANLELQNSGDNGCVFHLCLPRKQGVPAFAPEERLPD
jgi:signal transduction histidine kinase